MAAFSISAEPAIEAKAWDKFFCWTCQCERPVSLRVRFGRNRMPRCQLCADKKGPASVGKAGRPPDPRAFSEDYEIEQETRIPDVAVEAFEESQAE